MQRAAELWNARRHSLRSCPPRDLIGSAAAETCPLAERNDPCADSMKESRDEFQTAYRSRPGAHWDPRTEAALERVSTAPPAAPSRKRRRRLVVLALGASLIGLAGVVSLFTGPPNVMPVAPAWEIKVSSGGTRSVVALVYGKEAGLQLVRIPPKGSSRSIPARLGEAPVFMVSLGWSEIVATAKAPPGAAPMSWSAEGRVVQAFSNEKGTGVRVW